MYVIKLKGRKVSVDGVKMFFSYEDARLALRRKIRQMIRQGKATKDDFGMFDEVSRGPTDYTGYGFNIVNVLS